MIYLKRIIRGVAYLVFVLTFVGCVILAVEFGVGFILPPLTFPEDGLALPPDNVETKALYDFSYTAAANEFGMRDHSIAVKSPDVFRIAAVGDSYTFGWGVALSEVWIKRLEYYLREDGLSVEVLNVGKPGAGPWDYAAHASMALNTLQPDMLLVELLQGNDLMQSYSNDALRYFPNITRYLHERNAPPPSPYRGLTVDAKSHREHLAHVAREKLAAFDADARARYDALDEKTKALFLAGRINPWMIDEATVHGRMFEGFAADSSSDLADKTDTLAHILGRIHSEAREHSAAVVCVSMPNGVFDNRPMFTRLENLGYRLDPALLTSDVPDALAAAAAEDASIPFYEVTQVFREQGDDPDLYFELDHHLTAKGHDLFARSIAPFVAKEVRAAMAVEANP